MLTTDTKTDQIARRRCLMILSVLSGERSVTEVIETANISRNTYYQMEMRALQGMLAALTPVEGAPRLTKAEAQVRRLQELEDKLAKLEKDKRRSDRLLLLTRKVLKPGPVTTGRGRAPKRTKPATTTRRSSTTRGTSSSVASSTTTNATATTSTPTPAGEGAR